MTNKIYLQSKNSQGFSLFEVLVVVTIFALLGFLVTQIISFSLRGTNKSQSSSKVRGNLDYAVSIIERQLRSAKSVTTCSGQLITYIDANDNPSTFSCTANPEDGQIASGAAVLTSDDVAVIGCNFECPAPISGTPQQIKIKVSAQAASADTLTNTVVTIESQVNLRSYSY